MINDVSLLNHSDSGIFKRLLCNAKRNSVYVTLKNETYKSSTVIWYKTVCNITLSAFTFDILMY